MDRYEDRCFGIWNWIDVDHLQQSVSDHWFTSYVDNLHVKTVNKYLREADYSTQASVLTKMARNSWCDEMRKKCGDSQQMFDEKTCECKSTSSTTTTTQTTTKTHSEE